MIPQAVLDVMGENERLSVEVDRLRVSLSAALEQLVKLEREVSLVSFDLKVVKGQLANERRRIASYKATTAARSKRCPTSDAANTANT